MATSPNLIDLSAIPVPDAILVPDATTIFNSWLEKLRDLDTVYDALVESDPVYKQGEANAYQTVLLLQRINDAVRGVLLASALGADLDQIGAGFNVARQVVTPAQPEAIPPVDAKMEDDEAYRERIQLSWSQLSTAGARNAYRFYAKSADPDVLDAEAYGPQTHNRPGEVDVYVLSRTGSGTAPQALLDTVSHALNEDEVRPLTDYVTVQSAVLSEYAVVATLDIPDGPDAQTVLESARAALETYVAQVHRIGGVAPLSGIYRALHQPGVTRVHLEQPTADIEAKTGAAPYCSAITLSLLGGTAGAVRRSLSAVGLPTTVVEWWQDQPRQAPYTFRIEVYSTQGVTEALYEQIRNLTDRAKNLRSHLSKIDVITDVGTEGAFHISGAVTAHVDIDIFAGEPNG